MNIKKLTTKMSFSRRLAGFLAMGVLSVCSSFAAADTLTSIEANSLSGDGMEVRLKFDGGVPEAKGYSIEKPARIALDLVGADSEIAEKQKNLGTGNARSVTIVEAKDRTRLIFNLDSLTGYSTRVEGNDLDGNRLCKRRKPCKQQTTRLQHQSHHIPNQNTSSTGSSTTTPDSS